MTSTRAESEELQTKLLGFLRDYITTHGWAPSAREIMLGVDIQSTSTVVHHLRQLAKKGLIRRGNGPRQIALVHDTEATGHDHDTDL